jgi:hypothetical protein
LSIKITESVLRRIVREEVRNALIDVFIELLPYVDSQEQSEIERIIGSPSDYKEDEFVEWNGD